MIDKLVSSFRRAKKMIDLERTGMLYSFSATDQDIQKFLDEWDKNHPSTGG